VPARLTALLFPPDLIGLVLYTLYRLDFGIRGARLAGTTDALDVRRPNHRRGVPRCGNPNTVPSGIARAAISGDGLRRSADYD
jgi:hypothetical protein